jgi:phosphate starvation-inducible PhoH-like protein
MNENLVTHPITLESREEAVLLFGPRDSYLRTIRDALGVKLVARGDLLQIEGPSEAVEKAEDAYRRRTSGPCWMWSAARARRRGT